MQVLWSDFSIVVHSHQSAIVSSCTVNCWSVRYLDLGLELGDFLVELFVLCILFGDLFNPLLHRCLLFFTGFISLGVWLRHLRQVSDGLELCANNFDDNSVKGLNEIFGDD